MIAKKLHVDDKEAAPSSLVSESYLSSSDGLPWKKRKTATREFRERTIKDIRVRLECEVLVAFVAHHCSFPFGGYLLLSILLSQ